MLKYLTALKIANNDHNRRIIKITTMGVRRVKKTRPILNNRKNWRTTLYCSSLTLMITDRQIKTKELH